MLDYKRIKSFFEKNPYGYIELVQADNKNFCLYKDVEYSLDNNSITFKNITYTTRNCGNYYVKKGDFVLPFQHIIRVEYITREK